MSSVFCDVHGQFKARDLKKILAEARRVRADGSPYRGLDDHTIDPTRSDQNRHYHGPNWSRWEGDPKQACEELDLAGREKLIASGKGLKGRQPLKEDSILLRGIVVQASPEYFHPEMRSWNEVDKKSALKIKDRGPLDMEAVNAFWEKSVQAMQKRYGDMLLEAHLHLDETTPHIHFAVIPYNAKNFSISNNSLFPGKKSLKDFNEWTFQEIGKPLGLEKCNEDVERDPTKPRYESPAELQAKELEKREDAIRKKEAEMDKLAATAREDRPYRLDKMPSELIVKKPRQPEKPGIFASREEKDDYEAEMEKYEELVETYPKRQRKVILDRLNHDASIIGVQRDEIKNLEEQNQQIKRDLERERIARMEAERREEAARLRSISLVEVMTYLYPGQIWQDPRDKSQWRTPDGRKIGISRKDGKEVFTDNHDPEFKGGGAIDFVMAMDGLNVRSAIAKLRDYFGNSRTVCHIAEVSSTVLDSALDAIPRADREPDPPVRHPEKERELKAWMIRQQGIGHDTVEFLISSGQVYADEYANCVIPRPLGGAVCRGTVKPRDGSKNTYKRTTGSKKAGAAVITGPQPTRRHILAEGLTDALALVDRYPDAAVYIIGGNMRPDMPPLQGAIYLAFDNDDTGQAHSAHYKEEYKHAEELLPPEGFKDWAEFHKAKAIEQEAEVVEQDEDETSSPSLR